MAELLAYPLVEARSRQLGETGGVVDEADRQRRSGLQRAAVFAVDRDVDRLAPAGIADVQDVAGGDDEGPRGQRVRGDVGDHVALHAPGEDRPLVGEVVAGRAGRGGGDEPCLLYTSPSPRDGLLSRM